MTDPICNCTEEKQLIQVIEPEAAFCEQMQAMLSNDYCLEISRGTDEALSFMRKNADKLSLVMLDIQTAGQEGLELLKTIKRDQALQQIPVIVMTREKAFELESLQFGASDFIQTAYRNPEVVLERVKHAIETSGGKTRISESDELTGIPNQDSFFRSAEAYDRMHPESMMDAVCVDISSFHIINDLYGREEGNRILVTMAQELKRIAEKENGVAGRKAADVFLLYLPHREKYKGMLKELQRALTEISAESNTVRLKMGIYPNVDKSIDIQSRFDRAKLARDTIHYSFSQIIAYYDGEKYRRNLVFQQLMREMDAALKERDFKVYYQPKFDIRGDRPELISAEALVRWHHPSMGVIFPGMFVPLFEENGLITKLDRYVWREAAAQIRGWRDRFGITFPVSVNASRIDMLDADLTDFLLHTVHENDLEPKDLYIEITESAYTKNFEQLIEQVEKLRAAGFRIEMDDFGSGFSSLNMLSSISIDILKLDIGFIRNMFGSEKNLQMLRLMMQIKDSLNVPVIAEGVETEEQLRLLKEIGCDIVQGYYFSKPILPEEFETFIEEKQAHQT